jgi:hypothetical protein
MTPSVFSYYEKLVDKGILSAKGSTLDIGSYNVNGCLRPLFKGAYVGLDMREGPNVDVV